ncbi:NAD(P)-dependent dehydrogenase (short-subunit alcohol dehydrogenase family) [Neisseria sp. HSC-16F19]|nr:SDR family NAD(P)-dependent oxidoreductase [Neisseria sp. HSC-16F19]MCP2041487.1 NAD(P)-dependent dehydrogenase (short-subunit alcohol dehydrogenase family) [Neisseria sp. HSC-16F19]
MNRLKDKVVLVTGGASGIGKAVVSLFAAQGAKVAITDINEADGQALVEELKAQGREVRFWRLDVSQEDNCRQVVDDIARTFGRVDILINNAGLTGKDTATHETDTADWDRVFAIDVKGVFFMTKYAVPLMRQNGGGAIVNMSSIFGLIGARAVEMSAYHAAKAAVVGMTRRDAVSYAKDRIRVNSLHPGTILTPLVEEIMHNTPTYEAMMADLHATPYFGTPEDVAYAALFLASDEARFITGVQLPVDGGYTAQ